MVPELLELPHLVEQHGVPEMQIRSGGIEPRLHPKGLAPRELAAQVLFQDELVGATVDCFEVRRLSH